MEWLLPSNFSMKLKFLTDKFFRALPGQRTYIVPTFFGLFYALLCLMILYMAMASTNNLVYLFVFSLIAIGLCTMWITNFNVQRIRFLDIKLDPHFADEVGVGNIALSNSHSGAIRDLSLKYADTVQETIPVLNSKDSINLTFKVIHRRRGIYPLENFQIGSDFPFGLFYAWKIHRPNQSHLVYPARRGSSILPWVENHESSKQSSSQKHSRPGSQEPEFWGHRQFVASDSPRQVDWKAYARSQRLLVKEFKGTEGKSIHLSYDQTLAINNFEGRLEQLSLWISICEIQGLSYSLTCGPIQLSKGKGPKHFRNCLEAVTSLKETDLK